MKPLSHWIAATLLSAPLIAHAQSAYKCGETYSQTSCSKDALVVPLRPNGTSSMGGSVRLPDNSSADTKARSEALCLFAIKDRLKDPESARFRGVLPNGVFEQPFPAPSGQLRKVVSCSGYINAKNSYGGYTGDSLFYCVLESSEQSVIEATINK